MITAWIFFYDADGQLQLEEREGESYTSVRPQDWGLPEDSIVLLVFQRAQFINAWILGNSLRGGK